MKDRIPKQNGKNNIIKTAPIPENTSLLQLIQMLNAGLYADVMPNNATTGDNIGVDEVGTPINKANLLTDATAALYKLSGNIANVDQALNKVRILKKRYQVFLASGSFVVPADITQIKVTGCAAGGAGTAGVAGKAGQYLIDSVHTVTPGQTLTIVCGTGNSTIAELGISLLANTLTSDFLNQKLGIFIPAKLCNIPNARSKGLDLSEEIIETLPYPELFEGYRERLDALGSNGGMVSSAPNRYSNVNYSAAYIGYSGLQDGTGTVYLGVGGAFGAGGCANYQQGVVSDAGGYGAGGAALASGGSKGSPGFILIEW